MTQEEKQLLLKDLCARLPYRVKCDYKGSILEIDKLDVTNEEICGNLIAWYDAWPVENCKPFLRPMSSMTEEEKVELYKVSDYYYESNYSLKTDNWRAFRDSIENNQLFLSSPIWLDSVLKIIEFFNRNHFDYRGLISKGLALEAPEGMYNT